jgi:hypothetical protein
VGGAFHRYDYCSFSYSVDANRTADHHESWPPLDAVYKLRGEIEKQLRAKGLYNGPTSDEESDSQSEDPVLNFLFGEMPLMDPDIARQFSPDDQSTATTSATSTGN